MTSEPLLPEFLEITAILASTLVFDGDLTGRDRSILLSVSYLAGRDGVESDGTTRISDLGLRRALGGVRWPDQRQEAARYSRLEKAALKTDERVEAMTNGVTAPVVQSGMRRRTIGGAFIWEIDPAIAKAFAIEHGDEVVEIPLQLLIHARSRYTLQLLLRVLGWGAGEYQRKWRRSETESSITLRIPVDAFRKELGIDPATQPANIMRHVVEPATTEIASAADLLVVVDPVLAPGLKNGGRVMFFDVRFPKIAPKVAKRAVQARVFGGLIKRFPIKPIGPDDLEDSPF